MVLCATGTMGDKKTPHWFSVDTLARLPNLIQRRLPTFIEGIDIGSVLDQRFSDVDETSFRGAVQRCTTLIPSCHIRAVPKHCAGECGIFPVTAVTCAAHADPSARLLID